MVQTATERSSGHPQNLMGNLFNSVPNFPAKILILGLDSAGKTTLIYKLKQNEVTNTVPTTGFSVETLSPLNNVSITLWDVGGQEKIRSQWKRGFHDTHGLFFVVDSSDQHRFGEAREVLSSVLSSEDLIGVPLVVLANKQDLKDSFPPPEVASKLELSSLKGRSWSIYGTSAMNGNGLYEAVEQMSQLVKKTF